MHIYCLLRIHFDYLVYKKLRLWHAPKTFEENI